jgi:replicative DNA helicase
VRLGVEESDDGGGRGKRRETTAAQARDLLRRIRKHEVLNKTEAVSYGHRGAELQEWAQQLHDAGIKSRLATSLGSWSSKIEESGPELTVEEIGEGVFTDVQGAIGDATKYGLKHVSEYTDEALEDVSAWERGEAVDYVPTGFISLDKKITGIPVGELTIFAAPSGAGKTSFLLQLLRQIAVRDQSEAVCLFSIEMAAKKVIHRSAAALKGYGVSKPRKAPDALTDGQRQADRHRKAIEALNELPLYIDEDPEPTMAQINSRVMQVQANEEVGLVGVDYDEKVDPDEASRSEEQRVAAISKGLKTTAKRTETACVALSQYNSQPSSKIRPGRNDDLRYSRKKKHEASLILHWYWPHYWIRSGDVEMGGEDQPPHYDLRNTNRGRIYVGKNRDGGPGFIELDFYPEQTRFYDPQDPDYLPELAEEAEEDHTSTPNDDAPF